MDPSKLKTIPQLAPSQLLQQEPFPTEVPNKCIWPLTRGDRKGQPCNENAFDGNVYCTKHAAAKAAKAAMEEPEEEKKTSSPKPPQGIVKESIEILPSTDLHIKPLPNLPILNFPPARPSPTLASQQPQLSFQDMLSVLDIFSKTMIGLAQALKKDSPS